MKTTITPNTQRTPYRGRFAPSPSGPLHLGSLYCALASFLDAKKNHGKWLLRIEDIDPPREVTGASSVILKSLEAHGLVWDEPVMYQSQRLASYEAILGDLKDREFVFPCACTRSRLRSLETPAYDGHCLLHPPTAELCAWRLNIKAVGQAYPHYFSQICYDDALQGKQLASLVTLDDIVLKRKDGLYAYNLAVCVDDLEQNITHVVRGTDLLDMTYHHIMLTQLMGGAKLNYCHISVLVDGEGRKLSKQNHAAPIDNMSPEANLKSALFYLGLADRTEVQEDLKLCNIEEILLWAIERWDTTKLPRHAITI